MFHICIKHLKNSEKSKPQPRYLLFQIVGFHVRTGKGGWRQLSKPAVTGKDSSQGRLTPLNISECISGNCPSGESLDCLGTGWIVTISKCCHLGYGSINTKSKAGFGRGVCLRACGHSVGAGVRVCEAKLTAGKCTTSYLLFVLHSSKIE